MNSCALKCHLGTLENEGQFTSRASLENIAFLTAVTHRVCSGHTYLITGLEYAVGGWGKTPRETELAVRERLVTWRALELLRLATGGTCTPGKKGGFFPCPCLAASRKPSQDMRGHWNKSSRLWLEVSFLKNSQPSAQLLPIILCLSLPHGLASLFYSSTLVPLPPAPEGRSEQPCSVPCSTGVHMCDRWAVCLQLPSSQASREALPCTLLRPEFFIPGFLSLCFIGVGN